MEEASKTWLVVVVAAVDVVVVAAVDVVVEIYTFRVFLVSLHA